MSKRTLRIIAAVVAAAFVVLLVVVRILAQPRNPLVRLQPVPTTPSDTLVVIVHGLTKKAAITELHAVTAETFPGAHILIPDYDSRFLSNADAYEVIDELEKEITRWDARHAYQHVILIGHSAGGVFIRKIYIWAAKEDEDRITRLAIPRRWASQVERIVLLASINRGWTLDERPAKMARYEFLLRRAADHIARLAGAGGLVYALERGHPFIANLRMQWMRAAREGRTPPVFQLLGGEDEVVSKDDSRDVATAVNFVFLDAGVATRHGDIVKFHRDSSDPDLRERGRIRMEAFRAALTESPANLANSALDPAFHTDPAVRRVVFVKHGIRDMGAWTEKFRREIRLREPKAQIVAARYGLFPMASFLLFNARQGKVRQFVDEYTNEVAKYPNLEQISYFGHSNGTYLLASALERYPTLRFHRVVFAGSVVRTDYPWDRIVPGRVDDVENLVGSADCIVGIFPGFYEGVRRFFGASSTGFFDIGSAGFRGFEKSDHAHNIEWVDGGHGAGFGPNDANVGPIADYLTDRAGAVSVVNPSGAPPWWADQLAKFALLVWLVLIGAVAGFGWWLGRRFPTHALSIRLVWAAFIVLVLNVV